MNQKLSQLNVPQASKQRGGSKMSGTGTKHSANYKAAMGFMKNVYLPLELLPKPKRRVQAHEAAGHISQILKEHMTAAVAESAKHMALDERYVWRLLEEWELLSEFRRRGDRK